MPPAVPIPSVSSAANILVRLAGARPKNAVMDAVICFTLPYGKSACTVQML